MQLKIENQSDRTVTEYVFPVAVVTRQKTDCAHNLLVKRDLQITLTENETARIAKGGFLILDFGRELCGGVRILAKDADCKIRLRLGESVSETCSETGGNNTATNNHAVRDAEVFLPSLSDSEYLKSGFRFVRVDALESDITLKAVAAAYTHVEYKRVGTFRCCDSVMNRIFETAAHTVTLCMQNGMLWDGIKRDRLLWVGDMYPELLAGLGLYSETEYARRCIDFARETTPLPEWMNTMPTYSLWWIICLEEYVFRTGDKDAFTLRNRDYLGKLLEQFDAFVTQSGEITTPGIFLDWPSHDTPDEIYGVRAVAKLAMDAADKLYGLVDAKNEHTASVKRKLASFCGKPSEKKQAVALSLLAGFDADPDILVKDGAHGMSTFLSWAILSAAHDFASPSAAAEMCRDYYGAMLDLGATSFWEDFDIEWSTNAAPVTRLPQSGERDIHGDFGKYCYKGFRHSLCHGWSAGVIGYIQSKILGVESVACGGKLVRVTPFAAFGDMEGTVPVAGGSVTVEVKDGKTRVSATPGIKIEN